MNNSKFRIALPISLLILPLLLLVPAASASPSPSLKGYGTFTTTITSETIVSTYNGYTTYSFNASVVFQGIETGTGVIPFILVVAPNGHDVFTGNVVCSACTIDGVAGSFTSSLTGKGIFGGLSEGVAGPYSGSGGLAGLTAMSKFQSTSTATGFTGPYELVYSLSSTT